MKLNDDGIDVDAFDGLVDIRQVDLIINPYHWYVNGKGGVKAYLRSIYITIHEDALELKYRDIPEIGYDAEWELSLIGGEA